MKKIYIFYLYGTKDDINAKKYPAIESSNINFGNNFNYVMYAWTHNKYIRQKFKNQRDMEIFREVIHEINNDEFDKFSDEYSDTFLEERTITTKYINDSNIMDKKIIYILTTKKELDYIVENQHMINHELFEPSIPANIYIREEYFIEKYRKTLEFFKYDDIMSYILQLDENSVPFISLTNDNLTMYTHLYYNTYRKELNSL